MDTYRGSIIAGVGFLAWLLFVPAVRGEDPPGLARVNDFAYQLQQLDVNAVRESRFDLLVTDPTRDGSGATAWPAAEVARMKEKPGSGRRIVLAYLSIGEAEDYRDYWQAAWKKRKPEWLGPENPDWKGNYKVKYWHPEWRRIILGGAEAPLDRILAQGFDGVYLDIIDAFEFWQEHGVADAPRRMVEWVREISQYAKSKRPGFLVFPQNGEALGAEPGYLEAVDGIGREDLYWIGDDRQDAQGTRDVEGLLDAFTRAGKKVLVIEYCRESGHVKDAYSRVRARGWVPYCTVRALDRLVVNRGFEPD